MSHLGSYSLKTGAMEWNYLNFIYIHSELNHTCVHTTTHIHACKHTSSNFQWKGWAALSTSLITFYLYNSNCKLFLIRFSFVVYVKLSNFQLYRIHRASYLMVWWYLYLT